MPIFNFQNIDVARLYPDDLTAQCFFDEYRGLDQNEENLSSEEFLFARSVYERLKKDGDQMQCGQGAVALLDNEISVLSETVLADGCQAAVNNLNAWYSQFNFERPTEFACSDNQLYLVQDSDKSASLSAHALVQSLGFQSQTIFDDLLVLSSIHFTDQGECLLGTCERINPQAFIDLLRGTATQLAAVIDAQKQRQEQAQSITLANLEAYSVSGDSTVPVRFWPTDGKPVVLTFWASYCSPCLEERKAMPAEAPQNFHHIFISIDEKVDLPRAVIDRLGLNQRTEVIDLNQTVRARFHVTAFPRTIVMTNDGKIIQDFVGVNENWYSLLLEAVQKATSMPDNDNDR